MEVAAVGNIVLSDDLAELECPALAPAAGFYGLIKMAKSRYYLIFCSLYFSLIELVESSSHGRRSRTLNKKLASPLAVYS